MECARSRETVRRSDLAGWAEYGYCASHCRYFWGLRLPMLATLHGLPVGFALTGAKAEERTVLLDTPHTDPTLSAPRPDQIIIGDKNHFDTDKGHLNLEDHGGKTPHGVLVRVLHRILALTTAIWHNDHTGQPITRSLLAYHH